MSAGTSVMTSYLAVISRVILSAAVAAGMLMDGYAQGNYPEQTIKIIVPVPPGPTADLLPRIVAEKLAAAWGRSVIIENRPGGALNAGAMAVARATPDGYTLLATPAPPLAINQSLYAKLDFDPDAFVPVTVLAQSPNLLIAHPRVPASNLQELIAYARINPGKLTYASSGSGSTPHLSMELLKTLTGMQMVHVPYKGLGPALTDLIGGHVDLMFDNLGNVAGPAKEGRVKAFGVGSETRVAMLPDVPALAEAFPGFFSVAWFAIVAPPKTPHPIASMLSSAIADIIRQPDVAKRFQDQFSTPVASTPKETAVFISEERDRWRKVIVAANIKPE